MSGAAEVERVYSAIEESARLLDITCSRDKTWPVLTAYKDVLAEAVIVFAMENGRHAPDLDFSISVPSGHGDPYAIALSNGLTAQTDHPVGAVLSDTQERCPLGMYGIDSGVTSGFKKAYVFFPKDDLQGVPKLADIPSMPRGVAENASIFARHGLDKVQMTSVDYKQRTVNLYFGELSAEVLEPEAILSMLREMGLQAPGEQALEFAKRSFAIYPTLSWDSSKIERICFAVITTDPAILPARTESEIAQFSKFAINAPYAYVGEQRALVYGLTLSPDEEYYKLGAYYQISDLQRKLLKTFEALKD
jgi:Aromatic prenyltransferase Orf2